MLEPPDLPDDTIRACLHAHYGIPVATLVFLPIGNDSAAWVYRVHAADGATYFLKIRKGSVNEPSLAVPRYLHDHGVAHMVAPLTTTTRAVSAGLGDFTLALYPFIDGDTGTDVGMAEHHWVAYGAVLRQIHATALPPELARHMKHETFMPGRSAMDIVKHLDAQIATQDFADPLEHELAAFWQARRAEIRTLVDRADTLGRRLAAAAAPLVLCHADIHTWNILIDTANNLWIVDWDETILAPKERDLMFVVGGISADLVGPREEAWFFRGYGATTVDPLALAYYRYAWAVEEIGDYGKRVFMMPDAGAETRRDAVRAFMGIFQPGEIVALAYASDSTRV
jgi:spectinomycin phosphotransferase